MNSLASAFGKYEKNKRLAKKWVKPVEVVVKGVN
jgi:hypothetical protein